MCGFGGSDSNWVLILGYWSGVLFRLMVGFDGYCSSWWQVLHPLMWCHNERQSNERQWFRRVCSIWSLMVVGGWVWVILGLCWVCSLTEKTVAGCGWFWVCVGSVAWRRRQWLGVGDFGFVLGLWETSREEREGNNKKCKKNEYFIE